MEKQVFEIDGERFADLEEFFEEISRFFPDTKWGKNLNALDDLLLGAMGTPFDEPFILVWKNSALSRERLGYEATLNLFEKGFRTYSSGLSYDKFTRHMRRRNWLRRFRIGSNYAEVNIKQAQEGYRHYEQQIALARQHQGETIFDWIMDIFREAPEVELKLD